MKIANRNDFVRRLKRIPTEVRKQVSKDLNLGAEEMIQVAKSFAPKDDMVLVNSIRKGRVRGGASQRGSHRLQVKVKAGGKATTRLVRKGVKAQHRTQQNVQFDYALAQEFGTTRSAANPFFWPAYRLTRRRAKSRITRNSNKVIKRIFSK